MARAVYQNLTAHGYDCFLDSESIDAGSFERIILNQIAARAHFVVILTPSALERCNEPGDWLRREIEYALENKRNIVPLMFENFHFSNVQKYLTGKLNMLPQYNALEIPSAYFDEAMTRLQTRFLNKPLAVLLHPTPAEDQKIVAENKAKVEQQTTVTKQRLSAEEWFENGRKRGEDELEGKINDFTEAIRRNPQYVDAYISRGIARCDYGDLEGAIADYTEAIHIDSLCIEAYYNRGNIFRFNGDLNKAIADYSQAIRINSADIEIYDSRGSAYADKGEVNKAIADYTEILHLDIGCVGAYYNRGNLYQSKNDLVKAIADYNTAIELDSMHIL